MEGVVVRSISAGLSQSGVRNHNERLLLSLLQRHGGMPGSDLAKLSGLSPPTVSAILKRLETDGLLMRGEPTRGKVGKPSIPMMLSPDGVLSIGVKIGRRSTDLLLIDLTGGVRTQSRVHYEEPIAGDVFDFIEEGFTEIYAGLTADQHARLCGVGVAAPFEVWNWISGQRREGDRFASWETIDIREEIARFSDLPVSIVNDATAACQAEHVFGRGKEFRDYAYFFIGAFVGGGIVLNNSVYEGPQGNAGALGSLRTVSPLGESMQLADMASIHLLEKRLTEVDLDPRLIWAEPQDWSSISRYVDSWLGQTAQELAKASLSICSVIDFEAVLIDGSFPANVRGELVERVRRYIVNQDTRGLIAPRIEDGSVGGNARGIGAAGGPIFGQFLLNTNVGLAATNSG